MTFFVQSEAYGTVGFPTFSEAAKYVLDDSAGPEGYIFKWPDQGTQNVMFYTGLFYDKFVKIFCIRRLSQDTDILKEILRSTGNEYDPNNRTYFRDLTLVQQTGYGSFSMRSFKKDDLGFIAFGGNF